MSMFDRHATDLDVPDPDDDAPVRFCGCADPVVKDRLCYRCGRLNLDALLRWRALECCHCPEPADFVEVRGVRFPAHDCGVCGLAVVRQTP